MAVEESGESPHSAHTFVAVAGVLIRNGRVLVNRASYRAKFTLPSGFVERGEGLVDALRREVLEETAVRVRVGELLTVRYEVASPRRSDAYYAFRLIDGSGEARAQPPEIAEVREPLVEEALECDWISSASKPVIRLASGSKAGWKRSEWSSAVDIPWSSEAYHP